MKIENAKTHCTAPVDFVHRSKKIKGKSKILRFWKFVYIFLTPAPGVCTSTNIGDYILCWFRRNHLKLFLHILPYETFPPYTTVWIFSSIYCRMKLSSIYCLWNFSSIYCRIRLFLHILRYETFPPYNNISLFVLEVHWKVYNNIYISWIFTVHHSIFHNLWNVMTLSRADFEPAQRGHMCSSARRSNHSATGQGHIVIFIFYYSFFFHGKISDGVQLKQQHVGINLLL